MEYGLERGLSVIAFLTIVAGLLIAVRVYRDMPEDVGFWDAYKAEVKRRAG